MSTATPSWIGRIIGNRYEIQAILGRGGMSSVYRAYDPNLKRTVAIKIIHQHLSDNPEFIERFELEAAVIAQLRHSSIVQVHDFNHDGDAYYMVMEYIPGEPLAKKLEALKNAGMRMPLADTVRVMTTICNAVDYAHQKRMIHRDLKPANVMINLVGEPILMDFGIAKIVGGRSHTATGSAMGTATYMSPEQVRGEGADHRADIYSLGIMLYEILCGDPPFVGESTYQIMLAHVHEPVPDIQIVEGNTPNSLVAILERALAKDPDQRYQTAHEMGVALSAAGVQLQGLSDTLVARQMDRLFLMWQQANERFAEHDWVACLDVLDDLRRINGEYQGIKAKALRERAIEQMLNQVRRDIEADQIEDALVAVRSLRQRTFDLERLDELESLARQQLKEQSVRQRLEQLYESAVYHLDKKEFKEALRKWEQVQAEKGSLVFADRAAVERRAKEGLCNALYSEAIAALTLSQQAHARELWQQIVALNPDYPDTEQVATAVTLNQSIVSRKRQLPLFSVVGLFLLIATVFVLWRQLSNGSPGEPGIAAATEPASTQLAIVAPEPTETPTETVAATAVPSSIPTSSPMPTATATATLLPTAGITSYEATVIENASLFAAPDAASNEEAIVQVDDWVVVLGRSETGNWLYVRNADGLEGFITESRLNWAGNIDSLPIQEAITTESTRPAEPTAGGDLQLDLYPLEDMWSCTDTGWTQTIYMRGQGGNGEYTYYRDGEEIGTAVNDGLTLDIQSGGAPVTIQIIVTTSDGFSRTGELFISHDCPN